MNDSDLPVSLTSGHLQKDSGYDEVIDNYCRNSNWWAVFACFDLKTFRATPVNIAKLLGLSKGEVERALKGLVKLGYLREANGHYEMVPNREFLSLEYDHLSRRELADRHALITEQVLNDLVVGGKMTVDHRCFATTDEVWLELQQDLSKAFQKAFEKSHRSTNSSRIVKMTFTMVDVLKGPIRGEQ